MKTCRVCGQTKSLENFRLSLHKLRDGSKKQYLRKLCKDCESTLSCERSKQQKKWLTVEYKTKVVEYDRKHFFRARAKTCNRTYMESSGRTPAHTTKHLAKLLFQLWHKQKGKCYYTGIKLTRENAQIDHIRPLSKGGHNGINNLRWCIKEINHAKNNLSESDFYNLIKIVLINHGYSISSEWDTLCIIN